jgi:exosortase
LRWCWPSVAFLVFMLPLPYRFETALSYPLRRLATVASTYVLQTLGFPAIAEGNIILVDDVALGVVEACNGLGMLVTFFALSTAVTLVFPHSLPVKLLILASALPIAVISNILRITATAILATMFEGDWVQTFFHDFAGLLMVPIAMGLMWLELAVVGKLFVDDVRQTSTFSPLRRPIPAAAAAHS